MAGHHHGIGLDRHVVHRLRDERDTPRESRPGTPQGLVNGGARRGQRFVHDDRRWRGVVQEQQDLREQPVAAAQIDDTAAAQTATHASSHLPRLVELLPRQASGVAHGTCEAVEQCLAGESIQIAIRQPSARGGRECHEVFDCRNVGIVEPAAYSILREAILPYRVDFSPADNAALDRLVELGALDVESSHDGMAALLPDSVKPEQVAAALGAKAITVSHAVARDAGSVWILSPRPISIGRLRIVPAHCEPAPDTIRLIDASAFGTGLHPTTALCLEALQEMVQIDPPDAVLDVGTGSGVLALAALTLGVPRVLAIDIDAAALRVAATNARVNGIDERLQLARGGPESIVGTWPLVLANVLAAPLIEMAPALVRRVGHRGQLVLSGIPSSVEPDVHQAYRRLGMHRVNAESRAGWVALVLQASW